MLIGHLRKQGNTKDLYRGLGSIDVPAAARSVLHVERDKDDEDIRTVHQTVAEEESRTKSFIMNWSIERRFAKGLYLTPALLGYDKDEDGHLIINEKKRRL